MAGETTLLFLSALAYLSIKGRLSTYVALATTPAPSSKSGGAQSANPSGKSDSALGSTFPMSTPGANPVTTPGLFGDIFSQLTSAQHSAINGVVPQYARSGANVPPTGPETIINPDSGDGLIIPMMTQGVFPFLPSTGPIQ